MSNENTTTTDLREGGPKVFSSGNQPARAYRGDRHVDECGCMYEYANPPNLHPNPISRCGYHADLNEHKDAMDERRQWEALAVRLKENPRWVEALQPSQRATAGGPLSMITLIRALGRELDDLYQEHDETWVAFVHGRWYRGDTMVLALGKALLEA